MKAQPSRFTRMLAAAACCIASATASGGGNYELSRASIDTGGAMFAINGDLSLSATIGQPDAAAMSGGTYEAVGGFWFTEPAGDCDATGLADLLDYSDLSDCLWGPGMGLAAQDCNCFDMDGDGDTDLLDFADFQVAFLS